MLKALILGKKLESLNSKRSQMQEEFEALTKRESDIAKAIEEITEETTAEERKIVEDEAEKLIADLDEKKKQIEGLESEIQSIEEELKNEEEEIEEAEESADEESEAKSDERKSSKEIIQRGGNYMEMNRRQRIENLIQREDNRNFFNDISDVVLGKRAVTQITNSQLLIPEQVFVEIMERAKDYGVLVNLVDRIMLNGQARIRIVEGAATLSWTECCEPLQETNLGEVREIELDCWKLGGYAFLCKAFVEDAMINIADFVIDVFAQAVAVSLDGAIYAGLGQASKQPEGITLAVTETQAVEGMLGLIQLVGSLPVGKGEPTIAMNRKTFYNLVLPETYQLNGDGKFVYGLGQTLPDGTKIAIAETIPEGEVVAGYFKEYKLGVRKEMTFDTTDQVRWIEEEIGYKISGRFDGKVTDAKFFARGILSAAAPVEPAPVDPEA